MSDEYQVGYRRPPLASRFKKGKSGNPKGRPKASKNTRTLFGEEFDRVVTVREGGVERRITMRQAVIRQQMNKGAQGDPRAARLLLEMDAQFEVKEETAATDVIDSKDKAILDGFRQRMRPKAKRRKVKKADK